MNSLNLYKESSALSARLTELIRQFNITESQLARAIQIPKGTINRLTSGKMVNPTMSTLIPIARHFNISIDQLLGHAPLVFNNSKHPERSLIARIPVLEWEQLSLFKETIPSINDIKPNQWIHFECENESNPESLIALNVEGDAMWPHFDDKSTILVKTATEPQNRSFVIAYIADTDEIILRQLLIDGKSKILNPLNGAFSSIRLNSNDRIIGVVAHVKKSF